MGVPSVEGAWAIRSAMIPKTNKPFNVRRVSDWEEGGRGEAGRIFGCPLILRVNVPFKTLVVGRRWR